MIYFYVGLLIASLIFCVVEYICCHYGHFVLWGVLSVMNVFAVLGELMNIA